jgi:hypothetical protein
MSATPRLPLLKRVPPGVWTALTWCAGAAFTFLMRIRLPGEGQPAVYPGSALYRWVSWTSMAVATAMALAGSGLLRRRPLVALALMLVGSATAAIPLSVGEIPLPQFLAVDVALCCIAATRPRRPGIVAAAMALGVLAGYLTTRLLLGWNVGTSTELAVALTAVIAWLIGNSTHQSRDYAEKLGTQAAAQAVTAERLRIARELHDMVAHSIGIVALQAGAARRVIDTQPARARDALSEVETASRETLSGLRRMLGALRQAELGKGPEATPLHQMPGLADVDRLAAATTAAGVRVDVRWQGSGVRCHRRSTCRRSASSRSRSPTWCATRAPAPARCPSTVRTRNCPSRSSTAGVAAAAPRTLATASSGCASASPCTETSPQDRVPKEASR